MSPIVAFASFADEENVRDLEMKKARDNRNRVLERFGDRIGIRIGLVGEKPGHGKRTVEYESLASPSPPATVPGVVGKTLAILAMLATLLNFGSKKRYFEVANQGRWGQKLATLATLVIS